MEKEIEEELRKRYTVHLNEKGFQIFEAAHRSLENYHSSMDSAVNDTLRGFNEAMENRYPLGKNPISYQAWPETTPGAGYKSFEFELDAGEVGKLETLFRERGIPYRNLSTALDKILIADIEQRKQYDPGVANGVHYGKVAEYFVDNSSPWETYTVALPEKTFQAYDEMASRWSETRQFGTISNALDETIKDFNDTLERRVQSLDPSKRYTYTNSPERILVERYSAAAGDNLKVYQFELDARELERMERLIKERNLNYTNLTGALERVMESSVRHDGLQWGPGEWNRNTFERMVDELRGYVLETQAVTGRELHRMIQEELDFYKSVDFRAGPWLEKRNRFEEHRIYPDDPAKWVENNVKALEHTQKNILPYHMDTKFTLPRGNIHDMVRSSHFEEQWDADWRRRKTDLAKVSLSRHYSPAVLGYSHGGIFQEMARTREQARVLREGLEREPSEKLELRTRRDLRKFREEKFVSFGKDQQAMPEAEGGEILERQAFYTDKQRFKCDSCGSVYEDHYPVDDGCAVCKEGLVRITGEPVTKRPFGPYDQSAEWKVAIKSEGAREATVKKPAHDGRVIQERLKNLSGRIQKSVPLSPVERQSVQLKKLVAVARPLPARELEKG